MQTSVLACQFRLSIMNTLYRGTGFVGGKRLKEGRKEMFYLTTHSTHFIYYYMATDIWLRTILIVRKETRCRHIGYCFRLTARVILYTHHPTDRIAHTTAFVTPVVEHWLERETAQWVHPMKDRSDDPPHHERTLLPRSYISLLGRDCKSLFCLTTPLEHIDFYLIIGYWTSCIWSR